MLNLSQFSCVVLFLVGVSRNGNILINIFFNSCYIHLLQRLMTATENEVITYIPQIWCFIKSLTPPFLIEVSASSKKIEWSSIYVLLVSI